MVERIARLLREKYGAGAEEYVLEKLKLWAGMNARMGTMATWVEILAALERQAAGNGEPPE